MAVLDLTLFGGFSARVSTSPVVFPSRKARALVAFLSLPPGRRHPRDKLAALLWGDTPEPQARNSLRQCLFGIRRILAARRVRVLSVDGDSVALEPEAVEVDVITFERLVNRGSTESLEGAAALYQGALLEGLSLRESPFEDWLMAERRRLGALASTGLARLFDRHAEAGAADRAIRAGLQLLALDPLQEAMYRALMRLHAALGERGTALRQYQACAEVLRREIGVEPDVETQRLYREILRQPAPGMRAPDFEAGTLARSEVGRSPGARSAAPLTGRGSELARLQQELAVARKGNGRVVILLGEAGIGKSRLVEEMADSALADGWLLLSGRSYETEQMLPLGVWAGALRAAGLEPRREALGRLGAPWRSELARLLPEVVEIGVRAPRASGSELRLFEAITRLLEHLATAQPLLVVLEDLHWTDDASLRLTAFLARRLESLPVLVAGTARVEELDSCPALRRVLGELGQEQRVAEIALAPLTRRATSDLVRSLAASGTAEQELGALDEQVWQISEGNPFIAMETVRACQEGAGFGAGGAAALPARARAMLLGRVERLGERGRRLLDVAAVIGRDFEFPLLQRASKMDEHTAAAGLEELVRRRLLHGVGERFDFTHDRIWQVVYEQIPAVRRHLLHAAVGRAIEELHATDLAPRHAALAVHWTKGQVWDRSVVHLRAAGTQAAARGAYTEAVALFEQALAALERLPESAGTIEQAIDLRIELRDWLLPLGELDRLAGYVREAEQLATRLGDERRLAVVCGHLAHYHWLMGEPDRAIQCAGRTLGIAHRIGHASLRTAGNFYLGEACYSLGDHRRAVEVLHENAALTGDRMVERVAGPGLVPVMSRVWFALSLAELGRFPEALAVLGGALPGVEAVEQPYSLMRVHLGIGAVHLVRGDLERAIPALERASALVDRWDITLDRPAVTSRLGLAYVLSRRPDEGLPLLDRSAERLFPPHANSSLSRRLGEAYLLSGRLEKALTWARRALEHARRNGGRSDEAWAIHLLADIAASPHACDRDRTAALYAEARTRAEALGMQPLIARCHLGLGRLLARSGDAGQAASVLAAAVDLMRGLALGLWRTQAEEALAALSETAPRARQ